MLGLGFCECAEGRFCIEGLVVVWGVMTFLVLLSGVLRPNDNVRLLRGEIGCLRAWIKDMEVMRETMLLVSRNRQGVDEFNIWIANGRALLERVDGLLNKIVIHKVSLMCPKIMDMVDQSIDALRHHENGVFELLKQYPLEKKLIRGNHIPVRKLVGLEAKSVLDNLQDLLQGGEVGSIVIYGVKGIGKTTLMKHLHNCVLDGVGVFDHVFWVASPAHFTKRNFQDAVAEAVNCHLPFTDDLDVRAKKLSDILTGLGRCLLFLDDVPPKAKFSLKEAGIPDSIEGIGCNLVLTAGSNLSTRILDGSVVVEVQGLAQEETYKLFLYEAGIDLESVSAFGNIPRLLSEGCHGVPGMVVGVAARIYGIHDLHEWRNALFELGNLVAENDLFWVSGPLNL